MQIRSSLAYVAVGLIGVSGLGCAHVNRDEMVAEHDALRTELTAEMLAGDEALARDIEQLEASVVDLQADVAENSARLDALDRQLEELKTEFGATIVRMEGMIAFNLPVHFDFDSSLLREQDKPVLDKFAQVVDGYYVGSHITVEGFADPAGDPGYNLRLGARRAEGVKSYLVEVAQLRVPIRAVSYGEAEERQIDPGAWGAEGQANRRVTLVIDYRNVEGGF